MIWTTPGTLSESTGIPRDTLYKQLKRGKLFARKYRGRWYVGAELMKDLKLLPMYEAPDTRLIFPNGRCPACGALLGQPTFELWKFDSKYWRHKCMPIEWFNDQKERPESR